MSCKIHISFGIGIIHTIQLSDEEGLREPKKTFDGKGGSHKGYCIHDVEIQQRRTGTEFRDCFAVGGAVWPRGVLLIFHCQKWLFVMEYLCMFAILLRTGHKSEDHDFQFPYDLIIFNYS